MEVPKWVVGGAIALLVIFALYLAFFPLIKKQVNIFMGFGEEEPEALTKLKEACNEKQTSGCALEVARKTLEAGENPLVAESWLRKEIEFTDNEAMLRECFEFTKDTLLPLMNNDPEIGGVIYGMLKRKATSESFKQEIDVELGEQVTFKLHTEATLG